jgi:hypothetical protein
VNTTATCSACHSHMADLLLDDDFRRNHPDLMDHVTACPECSAEWSELQATFTALEEWRAPEPSAFFDARLHARLREAVAAPPEGFFERVRSYFLFSTGRQLRPALGAALALALVVGGGSGWLSIYEHGKANASASATLNDLKVLDNNAQALQQMDQLLDDGSTDDGDTQPTT